VPIYEYRCDACGNTFEVIQKFSDAPLQTCEACGGQVRRVLHPVAIHFKGSGFYTTDYAHKSSSSPSPNGSGDGEASRSGGEEAPVFKMSEKAKAENRKQRAEAKAAAQGTAKAGESARK
jgi:putative FmdB family regulatory protein